MNQLSVFSGHVTRRPPLVIAALTLLFTCSQVAPAFADTPSAKTTFESVGLSWSPSGGSPQKRVAVRYRERGSSTWREALELRYNPVDATAYTKTMADYRGSIVGLKPGTPYEAELTLQQGEQAHLTFTTWSPRPPEGRVRRVEDSAQTLVIEESGTPEAYLVYDGAKAGGERAVIDVRDAKRNALVIKGHHVILRNVVLAGAQQHGVLLQETHDVIIEDAEIHTWGRRGGTLPNGESYGWQGDAAIRSSGDAVERIVIQRNVIRDPRYRASTWKEYTCAPNKPTKCDNHTRGPAAIFFPNTQGNHVIRHNEIFSQKHFMEDLITGGSNGSYRGAPGDHSDIYGNYLANCRDDAIEAEGGVQNVRIWGNYIEKCYQSIGNAPVGIGPLYIFRNVIGSSAQYEQGGAGTFIKMGWAGGIQLMNGLIYIFHNTLTNPNDQGPWGYGFNKRIQRHVVSRNNILHVRSSTSASIATSSDDQDNSFDYDLYSRRVPAGSQPHGLSGTPRYIVGTFGRQQLTADYRLSPSSLGYDAGERLPNFNDTFAGAAPDIGAFEGGQPPMRFGRAAASPVASCGEEVCDNEMDDNCDGEVDEGCVGTKPCDEMLLSAPMPQEQPDAEHQVVLQCGAARARFTSSYDDSGLTLRVEVEDDDLRAHLAPEESGNAWLDDGIELYLDPRHDGGTQLATDDLHAIITVQGASLFRGEAWGEAPEQVVTMRQVRGTLNDTSPDQGYTIALTLPWELLGGRLALADTLGLDLVLNQRSRPDDGSARGAKLESCDWARIRPYASPGSWCALGLSEEATAPMTPAPEEPGDELDIEPPPSEPEPTPELPGELPGELPDTSTDAMKDDTAGCGCASSTPKDAGSPLLMLLMLLVSGSVRRTRRARSDA